MSRTRPAALLLAATLALTAGCGGNGEGNGGLDPATSPPASANSPSPGSASPGSAAPDGTATPSPPSPDSRRSGSPAQGSPAPAPQAARPTTAPPKVVTAFAACMRRHGVNVPDNVRTWTPPPNSDAETQLALLTCMQSLTPPPR